MMKVNKSIVIITPFPRGFPKKCSEPQTTENARCKTSLWGGKENLKFNNLLDDDSRDQVDS